jgi:hypothetical protein
MLSRLGTERNVVKRVQALPQRKRSTRHASGSRKPCFVGHADCSPTLYHCLLSSELFPLPRAVPSQAANLNGSLQPGQMLKMDRETRDIPVVVCTAAIKLVADLQPHLGAMGVGVVLKPFDIDHLLAEIDKMWRTQDPG